MIYRIDEIVRMVRTAINRNPSPKPLIRCRDPDLLPLDKIIISKINQAALTVYCQLPTSMLIASTRDFGHDSIFWHRAVDGLYSGHIPLPSDFLRLIAFEMSDWRRPVIEALTAESPYFEAAAARYSGARGTPQRPACLLSNTALGKTLEFHSCYSDTETIVQAKYLPIPALDIDGGIDFDPHCLDAVIAEIAERIKESI